jgi:hypothetical protein
MTTMTRRRLIASASVMGACMSVGGRVSLAAESDDPFDFSKPLSGWETVSGDWAIQEVPGASDNGRALVQRATENEFNVIVAPGGPYGNVLVTARFRPISGREDASGGIVSAFRKAATTSYVRTPWRTIFASTTTTVADG